MQTAEPLAIRQAAAPAPTKQRESVAQADGPASFRASMDKAQQKADAAQGPVKEPAKGPTKEPLKEAAQSGEEAPIPEAEMAVLVEQAQTILVEAAVPQGEGEVIEGLLPPEAQEKDEQPGEDVPAQNEAQMAILAALLTQGGMEIPQTETEASLPEEMVQAIPREAQQQELPLKMEAQAGAEMAAPWQAAVPQEGERALPRMEEPGAEAVPLTPEQENTLSGESLRQPAAMKAGAEAEQAGKHDMDRAEARQVQAQPAFAEAGQTQQHPVTDLRSNPEGEPLPEPKARQVLTDSLFEQVQSAVRTGKQELFVQLKPESLGGLAIHLSMTEEGIKAQVRTSSENVQHLVTTQIAQLEDALRARDIPVVQMDVIYDQTAGSAFLGQQQRQAWQESGGWGRGGSYTIPAEETAGLYEAALTDVTAQMGEGGVVYSA